MLLFTVSVPPSFTLGVSAFLYIMSFASLIFCVSGFCVPDRIGATPWPFNRQDADVSLTDVHVMRVPGKLRRGKKKKKKVGGGGGRKLD